MLKKIFSICLWSKEVSPSLEKSLNQNGGSWFNATTLLYYGKERFEAHIFHDYPASPSKVPAGHCLYELASSLLCFRSKIYPQTLMGLENNWIMVTLHCLIDLSKNDISSWVCCQGVGPGWRWSLGACHGRLDSCPLLFLLLSASGLPWGEQLSSSLPFQYAASALGPTSHSLTESSENHKPK